MNVDLSISAVIGVTVAALLLIWGISRLRAQRGRSIGMRDASLTCEELEEHARKMAVEHSVSRKKRIKNWPVKRLNDNYSYIQSVYKGISDDVQKKLTIPPAAEWLIDNFYIIEEQVQSLRRELPKDSYMHLPVLKCGHLQGHARIYAIARELVSHTDGQIDENIIRNYLMAYQSHSILSDREIWVAPVMLRIAIVESIRHICHNIKDTQYQWRKADDIADNLLSDDGLDIDNKMDSIKNKLKIPYEVSASYIEHISYRFRRSGKGYSKALRYIDENLARYGTTLDEIRRREHNSQASYSVSMGNCIASLKFISSLDCIDIFEAISKVEQILREDPHGTYPIMDGTSRNYYRRKIEDLASLYKVSGIHVAREAVELAKSYHNNYFSAKASVENQKDYDERLSHVGYYILGKGLNKLENRLGNTKNRGKGKYGKSDSTGLWIYLGSIGLITCLLAILAVFYSSSAAAGKHSFLLAIITFIAAIVPASEIAIGIINWFVCKIKEPAIFPRLELKEGIPEDLCTMVVVPTLLPDEKRVIEILNNLEMHYLSSKDKNMFFSLLGDFKDANESEKHEDNIIIDTAIEGIKKLNQKYASAGEEIFYFFHRERRFNKNQNKWMGWERKRGAIVEFNNLLLGAVDTSFKYFSSENFPKNKVKYVITLDADTVLPMGEARKMVGVMAHPLHKPIIDEKRGTVVEGYGLIQPRITFDIESTNKSLFARIFTGQEGIDPYASAISDVYQDLFGEGIFTGKGIYDLLVFQSILKDAIPENSVLSHDLLEGSHIKAGLATELELIDSYPAKYESYASRLHRWVRGDWQLLPWLFSAVKDRNGAVIKNRLGLLSRWKIIDNLRRSLVAPCVLIFIILSFTIFPGNIYLWLVLASLPFAFPLIISIIDYLLKGHLSGGGIRRHIPVISGLKATILQILLMFLLLPYQAYLMLSAIAITLVRVLLTKSNMLEWVTAADAEKRAKNSLKGYYIKMRSSIAIGVVLVLLSLFLRPGNAVPAILLMVVWSLAPAVAYRISIPTSDEMKRLSDSDIEELRKISRKTWRYFEEFVNYKNHFLAPDNFQEDPARGVAYRTSPTNIGLGMLSALCARDFGYIGTFEMVEIISNTVSTLERMEKWNGHLYNWYDTRSLRPLRPRYVSTVDSGNFAGYLVTLIQGLYEYLDSPVIDSKLVNGIKDTISIINNQDLNFQEVLDQMLRVLEGPEVDLNLWETSLIELYDGIKFIDVKKSLWKSKSEKMIKMLKKELSEYAPWLYILKEIESNDVKDSFNNRDFEVCEKVFKILKSNPPLKDVPAVYRKAIAYINEAGIKEPELLKEEIEKALINIESLIEKTNQIILRIKALYDNIRFSPLFAPKKQLFSIGYNIEESRLTNSYYDLLASEARQASYIAIARGEISPKHWFRMGRALTTVDRYKGLVSWSGTMFEYLMPLLIMKNYRNTLLDETYSFVIRSQKKYGRQRKMPWGTSESGFYSLDINLDYQYKAMGVPWLGLKRGLIEDAVVAPYSTFLALPLDPEGAMSNIKELKTEGAEGHYGFYEAIDYTLERLPFGEKHAMVKSYMAHHQGMSLLSINNYLNDNIMQKRFHSNPEIKTAELLLHEKVPSNIIFTKENKEKVMPFKGVVYKEKGPVRRFKEPDFRLPKVHILSNGSYSVMITDKGTGYSKSKTFMVTRWREDSIEDNYGTFFYIKNVDTGDLWSSAYAPFNRLPDKYEVKFTADKASFERTDGNIDTKTEIVVASGDNAEIRRISIRNNGDIPCTFEITSYFEVVLAPQSSDIAHPAFSSLFIKTDFISESRCIIANRRPRAEGEKSFYAANTAVVEGELIGDVQYETDRMQFIGRGHNVKSPFVIERNKPLSNSSGPVLDPIASLRLRVRIEPGRTAAISFITAIGESFEAVQELVNKYNISEAIEGALRLARTRSQVEGRYLNMRASEIELYQDMASHIIYKSPLRKNLQEYILKNRKGQSTLWVHGISGDLPIVLVNLKRADESDIVYEILKAHEYLRFKDLNIDLVIINDEESSYDNPLRSILSEIISRSHAHDMLNKTGGVYVLNRSNLDNEELMLLYAVSRLALSGDKGTLLEQLELPGKSLSRIAKQDKNIAREYKHSSLDKEELLYFNELGGFRKDGREYVMILGKGQNTPLPWINVISNSYFGFIISESGSGYTWNENSRENKLTPWTNDPVSDTPGEIIYIRDKETDELWTTTPMPIRGEEPYKIRHGFGYSAFEHDSYGIKQELVQFVPIDEPVKISIIKLKNISQYDRELALTYYIQPVLGVSDQFTSMHISTRLDETGMLLIENPYNTEFQGNIAFLGTSCKEKTYTGDRNEFFGFGETSSPDSLRRHELSGDLGAGYDPCAALQVDMSLDPGQEKCIVFLFGQASKIEEIRDIGEKYSSPAAAEQTLVEVKKFWENKLGQIHVNTPDPSMNILLNGWLQYQVIACRLWARSAFYQSGGAFGFRDQLQDSLSLMQSWPEITRQQILLHARHQFVEGDVLHWWHEPDGKGTRTRFSDDLLWLPFTVSEYVRGTGDYEILKEVLPFIEDEQLKEDEDERYGTPVVSEISASLYEHCIRAIEKSLKFGDNGLPLMGSGDWNDGMSTVGNRGKGESVWLGWFLYSVLSRFVTICAAERDEGKAGEYAEIAAKIINAIESNAWDGSWYRRAYFDNGVPLGSSQNSECKIDSISQAWAVISEAGEAKRITEAMNSVENYLINKDDGLIKLLAPPFDEGDLEPGYIKGYVPGVRENGGQYTHAAAWVIIAFAKLGDGNRAGELFELINPINHTRTHIEYSRYKAEPYVMSADVYAVDPHTGRGGWTWYTGSASWMYKAGVEYILGIKKHGNTLIIEPCIPEKWKEYFVRYKYKDTTYEISVANPDGISRGVKSMSVDGTPSMGNSIELINDGAVHRVDVQM